MPLTIQSFLAFVKPRRPLRPALFLVILAVSGFIGWKAFDALRSSPSEELIPYSSAQSLLPVSDVQVTSGLA